MDIYIGDTPLTNIYIGGPDYSAIQGPCDSGFHIPSTAERTAVLNVIGTSGDNYFTYLHIPKCGYRDRKTTNIITTYGFSRYWTHDMSAKDKANCWGIESTNVAQMYADDKPANGYPIRAFRDTPVAPDSDWTETLSGKVWYNATLGLISIKNGSEWITMQDKNIGATVVYNNGDTLNDNNTGSFFQFGNNYGFPYSGTLTTYTSLQDTTGYGWQNPYSDNHFVKINSNNWFSNTNNDIWGGVTGVVAPSEVQEVYEGDAKIRPGMQIPDSNTRFYVIGNGNITDSTGNITFSGRNVSYATEGNLTYIVSTNNNPNGTAVYNTSQNITFPLTFNMWLCVTSFWTNYSNQYPKLLSGTSDNDYSLSMSGDSTSYNIYGNGGAYPGMGGFSYGYWYNICVTTDTNGLSKYYSDGVLLGQGTPSTNIPSQLWMLSRWTTRTDSFSGKVSKILYQNEVWDETTVATWYNQNKSYYQNPNTRAVKSTPRFINFIPKDVQAEKK